MLRFLWFDDPFGDDHITITLRFKRFMFGLRSSASILSNIISTCIGKVNQKWQSCSRKHSTLTIYYRERKLFGKCSRFTKGPMAAGGFNVENGTATQNMLWSESKKQNPTVEVGTIALFIRTVFLLFQISTTLNQATLLIYWELVGTSTQTQYCTISLAYVYANSLPITKRPLLKLVAKILVCSPHLRWR